MRLGWAAAPLRLYTPQPPKNGPVTSQRSRFPSALRTNAPLRVPTSTLTPLIRNSFRQIVFGRRRWRIRTNAAADTYPPHSRLGRLPIDIRCPTVIVLHVNVGCNSAGCCACRNHLSRTKWRTNHGWSRRRRASAMETPAGTDFAASRETNDDPNRFDRSDVWLSRVARV